LVTIISSNLIALTFGIALTVLAYYLGKADGSYSVNFLICLLGATLGWAIGILISPYNVGEQQQFATLLHVTTAFVSGYLVSKFDPLIERFLKRDEVPSSALLQRTALFIVAFVLSATIVFIDRQYDSDVLTQVIRDKMNKEHIEKVKQLTGAPFESH